MTKVGDSARARLEEAIQSWEKQVGDDIDVRVSDEQILMLYGVIVVTLGEFIGLIPHQQMREHIIENIHKMNCTFFDKGVEAVRGEALQ